MKKIFLLNLLLTAGFFGANPGFALATNQCPQVVDQLQDLNENCNAFYTSCMQGGGAESTTCSIHAQTYVVERAKYSQCVSSGPARGFDCTGFNEAAARQELRSIYSSLVPWDQSIDVGAPPATPPSQPSNPSSQSGAGGNSTTNTSIPYTPLEPLPGLAQYETGDANFGQLLSMAFKLLIILAALIAVGSFVYAGISYMVSDVPLVKFDASKRLQASFLGLAILLGSWIILFTINPQLVSFNGALNPVTVFQQSTTNQSQPTIASVTTNNGSTVPVITAQGQDAVIESAKNNPSDPNAQAAAANVVQERQAACTERYNGVIAPPNNPCAQDTNEHFLGTKIYNSCATIITPTGSMSCYYSK